MQNDNNKTNRNNSIKNDNSEKAQANSPIDNPQNSRNALKISPTPRKKKVVKLPSNPPVSTNTVVASSNSNGEKNTSLEQSRIENQPLKDFGWFGLITPVLAILISFALASILAKRFFDKRKYGKNALKNLRGLKKAIGVKNELTTKWLKRRRSANIHAIGVGKIDGTDDYCIQVFVEDAAGQMLENPPTQLLPAEYQNLPIVIYEMPRADFLSFQVDLHESFSAEDARRPHNILQGGISGANANLSGESGTIGYFCRPNLLNRAAHIFLKKHVYLLSNSHVFADLSKTQKDETDLILHPSPGESMASKPIAELYDYAPLIFGGDVENPNFVDAAIAKLYRGQTHKPEIPRIGKITDFLRKEQIELRSACRKFGRTTGYTRGKIFSIHLSIWVKYSARGTEAFFKDQFLIIPTDGSSFVKSGDSGSLLADDENNAIGLIFAGAGKKTALQFADIEQALELENLIANQTPKIEHYGVANSISDVMNEFRIKIDV